jgi:hypothetical protein
MMLARIIQFLIGAAFGAGGGYLAWLHRGEAGELFPPGPDGLPLMLVAGLGAFCIGIVFLGSAIAPRPKRTARLQEAAARRAETLRAADTYYSERSRAADRDWRSGKLPPHADPQGATPPADTLFDTQPVRAVEPTPARDPLFDQKPVRAMEPPPQEDPDPLFDPAPEPGLVAAESSSRAAAGKPVATSVPPMPMGFPSTATLAPIPKGSDPAPQPMIPSPIPAPAHAAAGASMPAPAASPPPAMVEPEPEAFADIRAAIAAGRLEEADRLLNASRETATGLALANLTGLAGDHAAAAGRESNAKWLWRLALKRFGEEGALDSPAARQVSERLRLAGQ